MRIFAQKQDQSQRRAAFNLTKSNVLTSSVTRRAHPILQLQRTIGNHAVQRLLRSNPAGPDVDSNPAATTRFAFDFARIPVSPNVQVQPPGKLTINTPGDKYEQEADRVADQVMRMPEPQLQRACACGGGCPKCQAVQLGQEHQRLQSKRAQTSNNEQIAAPPFVHDVLAMPGQPLNMATRSFFEPHLGYDLSPVRMHTDTRAAEAARAIGAVAFTVGRDVVFDTGQYAPHTDRGRHLLAHELTHVVQQCAGGGNTAQQRPVERTLAKPRLQARWRLDSVQSDSGQDSNYHRGNGNTADLSVNPPNSHSAYAMGNAHTWQETGIVHQQVGGEAQIAHWVTKHFIFKNEGDANDMLQLTAIGQLAGNAKAEDLRYAQAGSIVYAQVIERTPEDPSPGAEQMFEIHDGGISTASTSELGEIEGNIPLGEGSVTIRIPLKKKDEGEFSPFSDSSRSPRTIDASVSEVDVILGARVEAASDIETAFFGVAPWLSRNHNRSNAYGQFSLSWRNRPVPAPVPAPVPGSPALPEYARNYWCNARCQEQCPDGVRGYLNGRSTENCGEATRDAKSQASRGCYPRHCSCNDSTGFRGRGTTCENHTR